MRHSPRDSLKPFLVQQGIKTSIQKPKPHHLHTSPMQTIPKYLRLCLSACLLLLFCPAKAQGIQGLVLDEKTERPIGGVSLYVGADSTLTDSLGRFSLLATPSASPNRLLLRSIHPNYYPHAAWIAPRYLGGQLPMLIYLQADCKCKDVRIRK